MDAVAESLSHLTNLRHLSVGFNEMGPAQAAALARSVQGLPLQHLSLAGNPLHADGLRVLAPILGSCVGLQHLDLRHTRLGPEGAALLAPALERLTGLCGLDLSANDFHAQGKLLIMMKGTRLHSMNGKPLPAAYL